MKRYIGIKYEGTTGCVDADFTYNGNQVKVACVWRMGFVHVVYVQIPLYIVQNMVF